MGSKNRFDLVLHIIWILIYWTLKTNSVKERVKGYFYYSTKQCSDPTIGPSHAPTEGTRGFAIAFKGSSQYKTPYFYREDTVGISSLVLKT